MTVSDWIVDGEDHLNEISTWYRIGNTGFEQSVSALSIVLETTSDVYNGSQTDPDTVTVWYEDPGHFDMEIEYGVTGGAQGSGYSSFCNCINWVQNVQTTVLNLHLFQYYDFDLNATPGDDTAWRTSSTNFRQFDSFTTLNVPVFGAYEVAVQPFTRNHLTDGGPSTLNNSPFGTFNPVGPGNVTLALQYDLSIPPGQTFYIPCLPPDLHMVFDTVPEPASWALVAIGGTAFIGARRKRTF